MGAESRLNVKQSEALSDLMTGGRLMPQIVVLGEALIDAFAETGTPLRDARTLHPASWRRARECRRGAGLPGRGCRLHRQGRRGRLRGLADRHPAQPGASTPPTSWPTRTRRPCSPSWPFPAPREQQFILYTGASALLRADELPQANHRRRPRLRLWLGHAGRPTAATRRCRPRPGPGRPAITLSSM